MKTKLVLIILLAQSLVMAKPGGMIGGGEVEFKSIMTCDAKSIDPTFAGSPYVSVAREVHYDGSFIKDANLRILTLDKNRKPVRYYVTHVRDFTYSPSHEISISIWQYDVGTPHNRKIGEFLWNSNSNNGRLVSSSQGNLVEELFLTNCESAQ